MTIVISWKIEDSSVWVVPEFASVLVLPLFMMVTLFAVIAYKKGARHHEDADSKQTG